LVLTYRDWLARVDRLGGWLKELGVGPGDRVGVLDYDSHRYLELFFAVPMSGAGLHTVNVRLTPDQAGFTIAHARDSVLFVHVDFLPMLAAMKEHLRGVRHVVVLADGPWTAPEGLACAGEYEAGLAGATPVAEWPEFPEDTLATLFYTTGTTGEPKGVSFSHRQIVLHTLTAGLTLAVHDDPVGFRADDVYLPLTPMFHVHAWGLPYLATMLGSTQVYPGKYEPQMLLQLLSKHRVTFSHCVPTLLQMLIHHPASATVDWTQLKIVIGGAALLPALAREAMAKGIRIVGGYGMSETCPIVAIAHIQPSDVERSESERVGILSRTGFALPLVQTAILDGEGRQVPTGTVGELGLRCPWLTPGYLGDTAGSERLWQGGWLRTGDGAYVDSDGYLRITDRLKDVIKIGGEWISSIEIESALARHPAVREVAVIGVPDPKWDEHPRAEVVLRDGMGEVTARELSRHLHAVIETGVIHKRAVLTEIVLVSSIPKTSVGKIDKKRMRAALQ
jgi:fatty-acyl-CoA synthase